MYQTLELKDLENQHVKDKKISINGKNFIIGDFIAKGNLGLVYKAKEEGASESNFVVKISFNLYPNHDERAAIEKEAALLERIYEGSVGVAEKLPVIIMPFLPGELLWDAHAEEAPTELAGCTYADRLDYSYQYFEQLEKLHNPPPPQKPAILSDIQGGNIKIDFGNKKLQLFDFGAAYLAHSASLMTLEEKNYPDDNLVAKVPEKKDLQIGLSSDIYGSVAPIMLIWGATNPGKDKVKERQNSASIDFDEEGLLPKGSTPTNFVIPNINNLIHDFIKRMQERDPHKRLQFAAEGKEFFALLKKINSADEHKTDDNDYIMAAKLIVIASGAYRYFDALFDFTKVEDCKRIVNNYKVDPDGTLEQLRSQFNDRKYIQKVAPEFPHRLTDPERDEIVLSHQISPRNTLARLNFKRSLGDFIKEYPSFIDRKELSRMQKECDTNYIDLDITEKLFDQLIDIQYVQRNAPWCKPPLTASECHEIRSNPERFQLKHLITELMRQEPYFNRGELTRILQECNTNYTDRDKTKELFVQVCREAVRYKSKTKETDHTRTALIHLLNKQPPQYEALANIIPDNKPVGRLKVNQFILANSIDQEKDQLLKLIIALKEQTKTPPEKKDKFASLEQECKQNADPKRIKKILVAVCAEAIRMRPEILNLKSESDTGGRLKNLLMLPEFDILAMNIPEIKNNMGEVSYEGIKKFVADNQTTPEMKHSSSSMKDQLKEIKNTKNTATEDQVQSQKVNPGSR